MNYGQCPEPPAVWAGFLQGRCFVSPVAKHAWLPQEFLSHVGPVAQLKEYFNSSAYKSLTDRRGTRIYTWENRCQLCLGSWIHTQLPVYEDPPRETYLPSAQASSLLWACTAQHCSPSSHPQSKSFRPAVLGGDPLRPAGRVEAAGKGAITGSCERGDPAEERSQKDAGPVLLATE